MIESLPSGRTEPGAESQTPLASAEFHPVTTFESLLEPHQREQAPSPLIVQTTGVTSQFRQLEAWPKRLLHKLSLSARLRTAGETGLADTLDECHSRIAYRQCVGCKKVQTFYNHCDNFWCPACQPQLARERATSIEWWVKHFDQPKHVVLTVRNSATLTFAYVAWFKACMTKLRRSKLAKNWRGGCWSLEVTNEGRGWHLHAHLLVDARWIDNAQLAIKWAKLVGQDMVIVKVKDVRGSEYLREVTKYAVKGNMLAAWQAADTVTFINAFQGQRTFGVFGSLYGKRKAWREWLEAHLDTQRKCDCGCVHFRIYDADEWDYHQILTELATNQAALAPPTRTATTPQLPNFTVSLAAPGSF